MQLSLFDQVPEVQQPQQSETKLEQNISNKTNFLQEVIKETEALQTMPIPSPNKKFSIKSLFDTNEEIFKILLKRFAGKFTANDFVRSLMKAYPNVWEVLWEHYQSFKTIVQVIGQQLSRRAKQLALFVTKEESEIETQYGYKLIEICMFSNKLAPY